jgi:hypothetical protein
MFDVEAPPPPTLAPEVFERLRKDFTEKGPGAAIDRLCAELRELGDYNALFYALLMKKRVELGVSPFPTGAAADLPKETHEDYEQAIREAGRLVGNLYLQQGDLPKAWFFFRMLDEPRPLVEAIDRYQTNAEQDPQPIIDIALYQMVHPKRGFDLVLDRYGICNAITTFSGQDWSRSPEGKQHAIAQLVRHLYDQLRERLRADLTARGDTVPEEASVREMIARRDDLFADDCYHIDTSHLSAVCQYSLELADGGPIGLARELCAYGERLSSTFKQEADPPFEETYRDYRILLDLFDRVNVEEGLEHFRNKIEPALAQGSTFPAEVYVNILLRIGRKREALEYAKKYLGDVNRQTVCPALYDLCQEMRDYEGLAESAKKRADGVNFIAGLIKAGKVFQSSTAPAAAAGSPAPGGSAPA